MPGHEVPWPRFSRNEIIMIVWFSVLGIELRDAARLTAYRLNRPRHTVRAIITHMDRINNELLQRGRPILCTSGMANWVRSAVDEYLIRMTDNAWLLRDLLSFDHQDLPLLREYQHIRLDQVVDVGDMQSQFNGLLVKHHNYWRNLSLYGRRNFY